MNWSSELTATFAAAALSALIGAASIVTTILEARVASGSGTAPEPRSGLDPVGMAHGEERE